MPVRNYSYFSKPPHLNADRVSDQMWKAHRYRNAMIEIERWKRAEIAAWQSLMLPGLADAQSKLEEAKKQKEDHYTEIKSRNANARSRTGTKDDREKTAQLAAAVKLASESVKAIKAAEKSPAYVDGVSKIQTGASDRGKKARAESGVWYGTYLRVEDHARKSFGESKLPPRFLRWEGDGSVSIHAQPKSIPIEDVLDGSDNMIRIELNPENPMHAVVYLRIGTDSEGKGRAAPIWAASKVKLHRPIPEGSRITWAYLERNRTGLSSRWQLRLTLDIPEQSMPIPKVPLATSGKVGVNLGWRKVASGLRVAYWVGSDGEHGELVIPEDRIKQMRVPEGLRSRRDVSFNEVRAALVEWMGGRDVPEWMKEATKFIGQWRAAGKLAGVSLKWREGRFDGDTAMFDVLEAWRKQDKHLCNWEAHGRSTEWRKEMYRQFALGLRRKYAEVLTDDANWKDMGRKAAPDKEEDDYTRWHARLSSVGELSAILKVAGAAKVNSSFATQTCIACGHVNSFDAKKSIHQTCGGCGVVYDQDRNAASNHLKHASAQVVDGVQGALATDAGKGVRKRISSAEWRRKGIENRRARKLAANAISGKDVG